MTKTRTDYALPVAAVSDAEIAHLEQELDRRRGLKAQMEAEQARQAEIVAEEEKQEQARKDALEVERLRRLEIVDRAKLVPTPSGSLLAENGLSGIQGDVIDVSKTLAKFGAVVLAEGAIKLPVVTCCGQVTVADGVTLTARQLTSQLLPQGRERLYLMAYRVAVRQAWEAAISAEVERTGEGPGVVLYTAAKPSVEVVPDEIAPSLVRIVGKWGDVFAYRLPDL